MRLILVRHCEPAWPKERTNPETPTNADPGLTDLGRRQAEATARELAARLTGGERPVEIVLSSPARRAQETAAPIATALGAGVVTEAGLGALGDAEMRRLMEDGAPDEELLARLADVQSAVWAVVERLLAEEEPPPDAIVVSHNATIAALICRALSMGLESHQRFRIDLGSLSVIDFRPQRTLLAGLNETCHLEGLEGG